MNRHACPSANLISMPKIAAPLAACLSFALAGAQTSAPLADEAPGPGVAYPALGAPDFSYAGLDNAAAEPPDAIALGYAVFSVTDYGAVPGDGHSDRLAIQSAVDAAEANGGPAVVLFPAGRFILRGADEFGAEGVRVRGDRIVLRGAGAYSRGTELVVLAESSGRYAINFEPELDPSVSWRGFRVLTDLSELPERGDREIQVEDASDVQPGDVVRLSAVLPDTLDEFRTYFGTLGDDAVIQDYFNDSSGSNRDWRSDFLSTLEVESVQGNTVRFTEPLLADYQFTSLTYKGGPRLVQIFADGERLMRGSGLEDIAFVGNYREAFSHHFNRAADSYQFVRMANVRECWIRRARFDSGTWAISFDENGRKNLVYDVAFGGNTGHFTITTWGNHVGNQASFLRELFPSHHGFGASGSAFGTVYHRCNQAGGPEGHGGYAQSTLFDVNEGDIALSRIGGAPPHLARQTVFWNWNQAWMVPAAAAVPNGSGRYLGRDVAGKTLSVWPGLILQPTLVGLEGEEVALDSTPNAFAHRPFQGRAVPPASLFEAQLRARLGRVPRWLMRRALTFEAITRYTQVDIAAPGSDTRIPAGDALTVEARLHPKFNAEHFASLELWAGQGHPLDAPPAMVASTSDSSVTSLAWTPTAAGTWRVFLRLRNSMGEEVDSQPLHVFSEPADASVEFVAPTSAWLQPRSLNGSAITDASQDVPYINEVQYRTDVRAIERPLVEPDVLDPAQRAVAEGLIDGDLFTSVTGPAALRWFGMKGFVFDFGAEEPLDFIQLIAPSGASNIDLFGIFDVQTSSAPESEFSLTGSDRVWTTVRRFGNAHSASKITLGPGRRARLHLPPGTSARYVRLIIRSLDSAASTEGNLSEIRMGRYVGL